MVKEKKELHEIIKHTKYFKSSYMDLFSQQEKPPPTNPQEFLDWLWNNHIQHCQKCLLADDRNHVVRWDGTANAKIMIVLEKPGMLEDLTALPLIGPTELRSSACGTCEKVASCFDQSIRWRVDGRAKGKKRPIKCQPQDTGVQQLDREFYLYSTGSVIDGLLLKKYKLAFPRHNWIELHNRSATEPFPFESPFFITNATLCRSWDREKNRDTPPDNIPLAMCFEWLALQYAAVRPKAIIALGRTAFGAVMKNKKAYQKFLPNTHVDRVLDLHQNKENPEKVRIYYDYHPSFIMRQDNETDKARLLAKLGLTFDKALNYVGLIDEKGLHPMLKTKDE